MGKPRTAPQRALLKCMSKQKNAQQTPSQANHKQLEEKEKSTMSHQSFSRREQVTTEGLAYTATQPLLITISETNTHRKDIRPANPKLCSQEYSPLLTGI
ncbi:hypothetical protein PoB_001492900 [Plakobranchus ocellatus]|uniref:Uncharacterized protein n=1 Tax=Plakobranchus ocellatus TaxID=259542 RepID=A0AAV3YZG5_9GAST|nr:hypothetical protein PoB_001492900 [Plakobranchus ocellatus]